MSYFEKYFSATPLGCGVFTRQDVVHEGGVLMHRFWFHTVPWGETADFLDKIRISWKVWEFDFCLGWCFC